MIVMMIVFGEGKYDDMILLLTQKYKYFTNSQSFLKLMHKTYMKGKKHVYCVHYHYKTLQKIFCSPTFQMRQHLLKPRWTLIQLLMFSRLQDFRSNTGCYRLLQSIIEYYSVLQSITKYYRVLQSITEYYRGLQRITEDYRVLQSIAEC